MTDTSDECAKIRADPTLQSSVFQAQPAAFPTATIPSHIESIEGAGEWRRDGKPDERISC